MKSNRFLALGALLAAGSLAFAGCGAGGTAESPDPTPTETETEVAEPSAARTIETMFGEVELPDGDPADWKVVALGWSDAEAALAFGIKPVAVYDWMGFGEENKGVGFWASSLFEDETPVVFPNIDMTVDYEAVAALEPDLILDVRSANDPEQYERLSSIAPTVAGPEGAEQFVLSWQEHTAMIAKVFDQEAAGAEKVAGVAAQIASLKEGNPEFAGLTAVVGTKFGEAYGAYVAGDARWDVLSELGFELYPPVEELEVSGFYAPVSREQVSVFDADVAVLFPIGFTLVELQDDPLLNSLAVVQDGRAVMLAADSDEAEAFSAMSILSIPVAVSYLTPGLATAAALAG